MDLFLAGCEGLGLTLAVGVLVGALAAAGALRGGFAAIALGLAAVTGGALFGLSLTDADHPAWPGWALGALAAAFSYGVARDVVSGARERAGEAGSAVGLGLIVALAALALAALSLIAEPVALAALLTLLWLALSRRRRAREKYEGLRVLR